MAQFARPNAIRSSVDFTGDHTAIDEVTASDADFAYGANNTAALLFVDTTDVVDPGVDTGHVLRYRIAKTNAGVLSGTGNAVTITAGLYENGVLIAADSARTATGTWTTYEFAISSAAIAAVTDYTDLELRFETSASGGSPSNRRGGAVSWAELEVPDASADKRMRLSWVELEVPTAPRRLQVSWAELEVPNAPRRLQVSFAELEVPTAPRRLQVSWSEFEVPTAPRRLQVSWAEFEVPTAPRRMQLSWAELEVPDLTADRRLQVSWTELEVPTAPRRLHVSWIELETPDAPTERRMELSWIELEVPVVGGEEPSYSYPVHYVRLRRVS